MHTLTPGPAISNKRSVFDWNYSISKTKKILNDRFVVN